MRFLIFLALLLPATALGLRLVQVSLLHSTVMGVGENDSYGIDVGQMNNISITAIWTGTPVGNIKLQYANDLVAPCPAPDIACNVSGWADYSGSLVAVSGAGRQAYNVTLAGYRWIRAVYIGSSSSGTFSKIDLTAKGY